MQRPRVAILLGPTGVGKTGVALKLAPRLGAQIINADSLQVYREVDIGTAKPTPAEQALVPHHLLDVVPPDEPYDAARYCREGRAVLSRLHREGISPLVVGGTGFYIKALLHGLFADGVATRSPRERLRLELDALGLEPLFARLGSLDPATAQRLHPHDAYRILRALEVIEASGSPLSRLQAAHRFQDSPFLTLKLGLFLPREELYQHIDLRVEAMLARGWLTEVRNLLGRYPSEVKPLKALGYRHLIAFLEGRWSWEETLEYLKRDTRRYAKRQLTWFRADPQVRWFHPAQVAEMGELLEDFFFDKPIREAGRSGNTAAEYGEPE